MQAVLERTARVVEVDSKHVTWDDEEECIKINVPHCRHVVALHVPGLGGVPHSDDVMAQLVHGAVCFVSADESSHDERLKALLAGCETVNLTASQEEGATLTQLISAVANMSSSSLGADSPRRVCTRTATTRQEMEHSIVALCRECPEVADVLLSAFAAALRSSRVATALLPFPSPFKRVSSPVPNGNEPAQSRNFEAVRAAMEACRSVYEMTHGAGVVESYGSPTVELLWWILRADSGSKFSVNRADSGPGAGTSKGPVCVIDIEHEAGHNSPFDEAVAASGRPPTTAYHGSGGDNWHSILRLGLENRSGGRFQRTGAVFGDGIYLSDDQVVAQGFSKPAAGWSLSMHSPNFYAVGVR